MRRHITTALGGAALFLAAVAAAAAEGGGAAPADGPGADKEKVLVRPVYAAGRTMLYELELSGQSLWAPGEAGPDWGKAKTELRFALRTKALRDSGACTFELLCQGLDTAGEGPDGRFTVQADRDRVRAMLDGKVLTSREHNPLLKPMTLTLGPLGAYRFSTGTAPIALYLLPGVDRRFWTLLTLAPVLKVAPGDVLEEAFEVHVPGAQGKPLKVTAVRKIAGWDSYAGRRVLAISLAARLTLKDANVMLRNGDVIHVAAGGYEASGAALWDVERGVLCSARAEQALLITADGPTPRALRNEARCALRLLDFRQEKQP